MKRVKKIFFVLLAGLIIYIAWNFKYFARFPKIISHFNAKEFCSCFYVMQQDESFCRERARQWIPIQEMKIDHEKKQIWVRGFWQEATAQFENLKYGCTLEGVR